MRWRTGLMGSSRPIAQRMRCKYARRPQWSLSPQAPSMTEGGAVSSGGIRHEEMPSSHRALLSVHQSYCMKLVALQSCVRLASGEQASPRRRQQGNKARCDSLVRISCFRPAMN